MGCGGVGMWGCRSVGCRVLGCEGCGRRLLPHGVFGLGPGVELGSSVWGLGFRAWGLVCRFHG